YRDTMQQLQETLAKLRLTENSLTTAAAAQDTETMNQLVSDSQPDMLTFRGLENKREEYEQALGIHGKSFQDVLTECTDEQRETLTPIYESISHELKLFEDAKDSADRIMKVRLMDVNEALKDMPFPSAFPDTHA
ncbi:MAG: hypothetical protein SPL65_00500, partial [Lachnospiraceae bacterium]|nr:hypothetical protein [Lachnospiraceae bacterium]